MESGKSIDGYQYEERGSADPSSNVLELKIEELIKIKEDLKKAKDDATQSWLDSRPLVNKLEKLQKDLANEKDRATKSNAVILDLESQLERHRISIQLRKEEEVKIRERIDQITQSSDKLQEMELLRLEKDEERRARSKLKQVLRLRKQTLQALQLTVKAVKIESQSYGAQSATALHYISFLQTDNDTVQLTQKEYDELTIKAREETALADRRVALAMEQRSLAEKNRELAQTRLQGIDKDSRSRGKKIKDNISSKENIARKADDSRIVVENQGYSRQITFTKARAKLIAKSQPDPKQLKKLKCNNKRTAVKIKKTINFCSNKNLSCAQNNIMVWMILNVLLRYQSRSQTIYLLCLFGAKMGPSLKLLVVMSKKDPQVFSLHTSV